MLKGKGGIVRESCDPVPWDRARKGKKQWGGEGKCLFWGGA